MSASEEEDDQLIAEDPADEGIASSSEESESGDSVIESPNDRGGEAMNEEGETVPSGEGDFPGDDSASEEEEDDMASAVASASAQASKFISEADSEEGEDREGGEVQPTLREEEGDGAERKESEEREGEEEEQQPIQERWVWLASPRPKEGQCNCTLVSRCRPCQPLPLCEGDGLQN